MRNALCPLLFTAALLASPSVGYGKVAEDFLNQGSDAYEKNDFDLAVNCYTEAIRLKPDYARAYDNRGLVYASKGEYDKAIADLTEAIRLDPKRALPYYNRAVAYDKKGDKSKAESDRAEAKRLGR